MARYRFCAVTNIKDREKILFFKCQDEYLERQKPTEEYPLRNLKELVENSAKLEMHMKFAP